MDLGKPYPATTLEPEESPVPSEREVPAPEEAPVEAPEKVTAE